MHNDGSVTLLEVIFTKSGVKFTFIVSVLIQPVVVSVTFKKYKPLFYIPKNWVYLDGNSLGPLTKNIKNSISKVVTDEWGEQIIKGWNKSNWMTQPDRIGNVIAKLIGASKNSVTVGDTLAIKLFQAISGAHQISKKNGLILSDKSNFPSDLYIANSYLKDKNLLNFQN